MALARAAHRRQWFEDARDNDRRMELTWHRDEHLVVVGLWRGSTCRATFRMPVEDVPTFVHALTDTLADAAGTPPPAVEPAWHPARSAPRRLFGSRLIDRVRRAWSKPMAEVVNLARYRR